MNPIEIIGGGLAGLSLGLALRRHDVSVTVHEAGSYPRHRVCGEFIAGLAGDTIAALGLDEMLQGAQSHGEVAWFLGGEPARINRLPAPALGLSRHALDARLAHAFVAAGGDLKTHSRATDLTNRPGRVFAAGRRRHMRSPWLGLKLHVRGFPLARGLEMHLGTQSYVGLAEVESGEVNLCGLFRRRALSGTGPALLLAYLRAAGLGALAQRVSAAETVDGSFCAVAALGFDRRVPAGEGVFIGDALAMTPPFTGNGMAMAFQSAEVVLPHLLSYARGAVDWTQTCGATQRALRGRFRMRLASAGALHSFLLHPARQRWFAALSRSRLLPFRSIYAALH